MQKQKEQKFVELLDSPVVQSIAFALVGVSFYAFLPEVIVFISQQIPESFLKRLLLDLPTITTISPNDQGKIASFIEWFGVLYGLILALVLVNVWTQFAATERAFDSEADSIFAIYNTSGFLVDDKLKLQVYKSLKEYVAKVIEKPEIDESGTNSDENTQDDALKNIGESIKKIINDKKEHDLAIRLLDLQNALLDNRGDRISYAKQRLPQPVKYLSNIASIAWLIPFFALKFDNPIIGPVFIITVTWVVVSILLIIEDLDNPIGGSWGIKFSTWENLKRELEREYSTLEEKQNNRKKI